MKAPDMRTREPPKYSNTCDNCRSRHVKCSGGPLCQNCACEGVPCLFKPSLRGHRVGRKLSASLSPPEPCAEPEVPGSTCVPCRARHIRCSGHQPCTKCKAEGLSCTRKPSRRGRRSLKLFPGPGPVTDYVNTRARSPPASLKLDILTDPTVRRSFCYFREKTSRRMSNNHCFWDCLVLQVSQSHAAIQHAIVALGAIDESLTLMYQDPSSTQGEGLQRLSLQQWNQSIALLTHHAVVPPSAGILLLSCVLYRILEMMTDGIDSGLEILRRALEILKQWRTSDASVSRTMSEAELVDKHVSPMIRGASADFVNLIRDYVCVARHPKGRAEDDMVWPLIPESYPISDVYNAFKVMSTKIGDEIGGLLGEEYMLHLSAAICRSENLLKSWSRSTRHVRTHASSSGPATSRRAAVLLQIHYNLAIVQLKTAPFRDEMLFDAYNDTFQKIIELCQDVERLEAMDQNESTAAATVIHTVDCRIIMPLVLVAARCRDPKVRRQAVHVLYTSGRMERIWRGRVAGMMVKQIVEIEERGLREVRSCADIPASHRIRLLKFHYDPGIASLSGRHPPVGFLNAKPLAPEVTRSIHWRSPSFTFEWISQPFDEKCCRVESTTVPLSVEDATSPQGPGPGPWSVHLPYDWHTQWRVLLLKCGAHPGLQE